jgi:PAT family acetyl-CoA transporter-like MFS transporter 1
MSLFDAEFCNKWIRKTPADHGVVTVSGTFVFWGLIFLTFTVLVAIFVKEKPIDKDDKPPQIVETYKSMGRICMLDPVKILFLIHFTSKIGTGASGELAMLKLTERGVSRANMALLSRNGSLIK